MPRMMRSRWVVCHELAHTISSRKHSSRWTGRNRLTGIAAHGWEFCGVYLDLVQAMLGAEARLMLEGAFKKHRVRFRPPIKRHLTEEAKQVLRQRLVAAREAKLKKKE